MPDVIKSYGIGGYTFVWRRISDDLILQNIQGYYPIIAQVEPEDSRYSKHAAIVYATNISNGYTYGIDPLFGKFTFSYSYSNNKYSYVSAYNNVKYTWEKTIAKFT